MSAARGAARMHAFIDGVGLIGPGISDWRQGVGILLGEQHYLAARTQIAVPAELPAAERRRVGRVVKLALSAGLQALEHAVCNGHDLEPSAVATVFSSSGADGENCDALCASLASAERDVSPTRFHNSVHNVASGYWGIAVRSMAPSTALCAYDASFAAGLLEAVIQSVSARAPVLLIAYDADYPAPLKEKRPIPDAFAVGLVISSSCSQGSLAQIALSRGADAAGATREPALESLRASIPAARSLPLLELLARRASGSCALEYLAPESLLVQLDPC